MSLAIAMQNNNNQQPVPLFEKCQYTSKSCPERRAIKTDGQLHTLCEFHRQLANRNQARLQQRRRERREATMRAQAATSSPQFTESKSNSSSDTEAYLSENNLPRSLLDPIDGLALEDLEILLQLLDSDDDGLFQPMILPSPSS